MLDSPTEPPRLSVSEVGALFDRPGLDQFAMEMANNDEYRSIVTYLVARNAHEH